MATFKRNIGIEVEYFVLDEDGNVRLPGLGADVDDFPLLGEIRGDHGKSTAETYANFVKAQLKAQATLAEGNTMDISAHKRVGLATYQQAMRRCEVAKGQVNRHLHNLYGIKLQNFSDQIIKDGKIQGIEASCGVHIHFSCRKTDTVKVREQKYEDVILPIGAQHLTDKESCQQLLRPTIRLCRETGLDTTRVLTASASMLNKPTIEWMVRQLDEKFFDRFMAGQRITKYRQKGFYEIKPYGFEYRSLPATEEVIAALPEIIEFGFELLQEASVFA